jgi:WD40 repeat protein
MVVVADVATGEELSRRPVQGSIVSAAFNRQGDLLAAINTGQGESGVWNIKTNQLICETPGGSIFSEAIFPILSPDGRFVAAKPNQLQPSETEDVVVFDVDSATRIALIESPYHLGDIQFSADNRFVVGRVINAPRFSVTGDSNSSSMNSHVFIWKLPEGKRHSELGPYPPFRAPVSVEFSRDGSLIAVGRRDGVTEVWDVERNEELFQFQDTAGWGQRTFTPDGRKLAWSSPSEPERTSSKIEYLDLSLLQQQLRQIRLDW